MLDASDLELLIDGLKVNDLHLNYSHILTGYVGSLSFLEKVWEVVKDVKQLNPGALYVCDPVMGDGGEMVSVFIIVIEDLKNNNDSFFSTCRKSCCRFIARRSFRWLM